MQRIYTPELSHPIRIRMVAVQMTTGVKLSFPGQEMLFDAVQTDRNEILITGLRIMGPPN
jgi:hypothetical protein